MLTQDALLFRQFLDFPLQTTDLVEEAGDRFCFRVRQTVVVEIDALCLLDLSAIGNDHPSGDTNDGGIRRHFLHHHGVGSDLTVVTHRERTQNLCAGADNHIISQGGMSFLFGPGGSPESHAVVQGAVVANLSGLADDNPHSMIDEKSSTDLGTGMNLDPGKETSGLREKPPQKVKVTVPEGMGQAIKEKDMKSRITENHLHNTSHGGITFEHDLNVFFQRLEHHPLPLWLELRTRVTYLSILVNYFDADSTDDCMDSEERKKKVPLRGMRRWSYGLLRGGAKAGRVKENRLPSPRTLSTHIRP